MGRLMLAVCVMCGKCEKEYNSKEFKHQDFCPNCVKKYKLKLTQYHNGELVKCTIVKITKDYVGLKHDNSNTIFRATDPEKQLYKL